LLVLPMAYFLLQAPAFLLVKLEDPIASGLLRGMFDKYYLVLAIAGAVAARRWFLQRMDGELRARDAGDQEAVRRLRRLHWGGIVCNVLQLAAVVASVPFIAEAP